MNNIILISIIVLLIPTIIFLLLKLKYLKRKIEVIEKKNNSLSVKLNFEKKDNLKKDKLLAQRGRLAVMGEMMGAIIHQWKQPLNGISIASSAIDMYIMMDDFDKEMLLTQTKTISGQIQYMDTTINDFRGFFKEQPKSRYELSSCVNKVLKLVGKVYDTQHIKFDLELEDKLYIMGYPNEINQVIINIFNNARDIILENEVEIKIVFVKIYKEENKAILTISDCAGGIPDDIIDKIFNPYVTTKSDDKGTGIGLDISKNIIEKVEGSLTASNIEKEIDGKIYKGAEFKITLDLLDEISKEK